MRPRPMIREFRYAVAPEYAPWMADAACADVDPDIFFAPKDSTVQAYAEARAICASCPVLQECRAWGDRVEGAFSSMWWYGMLAGETPNERRRRRPRAQRARQNRTECPLGHPYNEENTSVQVFPNGNIHRRCRNCMRIRKASRAVRSEGKRAALESPRRSA